MTDTSPVLLSSLVDALPAGRNAVFAGPRPLSAAPTFAPAFPVREEGVLFRGRTLPAFGLFAGVPSELRAACAQNVVVCSSEDADRFVVELVQQAAETRLFVARTPRLATLGATIEPVVRKARSGPSLWSRLRGRTRLTATGVLKVPPLAVRADDVTFRLAGGGPAVAPGEQALGRGEMYDRYLVCDGSFVVLLLSTASGGVEFALWVEDAPALALPA